MGQKVNPRILRIPGIRRWNSVWFAKKDKFKKNLEEDVKIRRFLYHKLRTAGLDKVDIERSVEKMKIILQASNPGLIIGRGGADIEKLKKEIKDKFLDKKIDLEMAVQEVAKPFLSAQIMVQSTILELEKRVPYRRVMKKVIEQVKEAGAMGVKISLRGRLDGIEIARCEKMSWGRMPLHTLRANIDYARGTAFTTYGAIGVKVWIYTGEVFDKLKMKNEK